MGILFRTKNRSLQEIERDLDLPSGEMAETSADQGRATASPPASG